MDTIFMNSGNSKTSDPHRLLLNLQDKRNLKRNDKYVTLRNLSIYYTWKDIKDQIKILNLKYQLQHGMKNLNCLMDHNSVSDIQDYFEHIIKKHETVTDNSSIRIYVNKIEQNRIRIRNRIRFKIQTQYYLELLTPKTMKLLGSTKSKITKDKNDENLPHLETTEVAL